VIERISMRSKAKEEATRVPLRDHAGSEEGFTLIELLVVVLIIGILIAIAMGTFRGARERAADRAAQSNIRTGLITAMSHYVQDRSYTGFDVPTAESVEPSLDWMSPGPPDETEVDIEVASGDFLLLVGKSRSGTYYCLGQIKGNPLTERGKSVNFADVDTVAECVGGW
jgi:type IV pilus assembly protein PilA